MKQLVAVAALLALCVGNVALCDGWEASPEARMTCCASDGCPMHQSQPDAGSTHVVGQAQADSCCTLSESHHSSRVPSAVTLSGSIVALRSASEPVTVVVTAPILQAWRTLVPLPVSSVPKHLLLSVFLV